MIKARKLLPEMLDFEKLPGEMLEPYRTEPPSGEAGSLTLSRKSKILAGLLDPNNPPRDLRLYMLLPDTLKPGSLFRRLVEQARDINRWDLRASSPPNLSYVPSYFWAHSWNE
jgi:hypothetical protein